MSQGYTVRDATKDDLRSISALIYEPTVKWFGNKRPKYEKNEIFKKYQTHRMAVELNDTMDSSLIAYAEFRNYPAIGPMPSDSWLEWLNEKYCITDTISWLNTMFFNFCVYQKEHPEALLALLREVFYIENRVWYLITVRTPVLQEDLYYAESFDDLEKYATVYYPREFSISSNSNTQSLYITKRFRVLPKITYRKALAEDNDDIIEIHEHELPEMRAELGDFYIAEELMRTDEDAKNSVIIVAELVNEKQDSHTAGFIWLDAKVDIRFYVQNFEMDMFGNLVKFSANKPFDYEQVTVSSVERKAEANLFTADAMDDLNATTIIGGVQRNDSGISVASLSKLKVSSIHGNIVDTNVSTSQDKFYSREDLYMKFVHIFEKLVTTGYYINEQNKYINLHYNTDTKKRHVDGVQSASNVFELKYICVKEHFPLPRLFSCLNAMYAAFPDRDYCIMTIPKSLNSLRSHVEALKYFMPVAMRPTRVANLTDIYITHRSAIFGEISLYRLESTDFDIVVDLAKGGQMFSDLRDLSSDSSFSYNSKVNAFVNIDNEVQVIQQIMNDVLEKENSNYDVFTIRCGNSTKAAIHNTAIGFVILRKFLHYHELHYHYHLPNNDQHLDNERAEIISLRLHPLFSNCCDVILRNLAAKTRYFDFYFIYARNKFLFSNDLKTMMMPIEPTPMKKFFFTNIDKKLQWGSKTLLTGLPDFDYYRDHLVVFRHRLNPSQWFGKTTRLVIIGFTANAKAFLRQLVFQWNTKDHANAENYNCLPRLQVTVIAAPGLVEAEYDCMFDCPYCPPGGHCYLSHRNYSCYVRDVVMRMDLRLWVQFLPGHVNYINREKKFVKINKTCEIYYDTLLLMNYLSFRLKVDDHKEDHPGRIPSNFIELNNRLDKFLLFYKLRVLIEEHKRDYLILMYGCNLHTYECIAFLISHGVAPERIILVLPHKKIGTEKEQKLTSPFVDENLQYILDDILEDLEVQIHRDLTFAHWVQHGTANFILEVVFKPWKGKKERVSFDCDIFISFQEGCMDSNTEEWLKASEIKLRGRHILVNKNFQTNDPDIYAVGKHIEIDESINHQYQYTNEKETAIKLMQILELREYDTPIDYKYSQPSFFKAILPLGYFITKLTMPRRYLASYALGCTKCSLSTYLNNTFCRIGLTPKMIVDEIVVVTKQSAPLDYLEHFCGKHEKMLNNLKARYKAGNIKCFLRFLQEPWTELLMHDDFEDFQAENHKMLMPLIQNLDLNTENNLREVNKQLLEQNLLDFIRKRRGEFHHDFVLPEDYLHADNFGDLRSGHGN
ncbi:cilia- and flagella-associated protein 61 isoform X1 [Drosophila novamexicana]|uniref:cilia- and flagella-associated protein 61 isoform X1 n=1 Tax=Drosophila novamexicana TaxID=47314 RepID=UPI0011E60282|nr:cilia- and flagella-associated protein 61 isoform X1 [Drosophila novamexicana]